MSTHATLHRLYEITKEIDKFTERYCFQVKIKQHFNKINKPNGPDQKKRISKAEVSQKTRWDVVEAAKINTCFYIEARDRLPVSGIRT